jgi:alpha-glucosidase
VAELPNGGYALVSEADVYGYSGMALASEEGSRMFRSAFLDDSTWTVPGGSTSPWRFVLFSDDLDGLVNSDLVTNLNPPPDSTLYPKGVHTEWIEPGRAAWRWWSQGTGTPKQEQQYIDYAARLGFEYTVIDAGWEDWSDKWEEVRRLVDYGHQRGVEVWLWKRWNAGDGFPGKLRLNEPAQRQEFFAKASEAGVVGIKIDYMDSESQERLRFYQRALIDAARYELMVNFHGANKPAGGSRTYPNEVSREGVRGLEHHPLPPRHNAALPFTRGAIGAVDYHGVTFNPERLKETTLAHQLATAYCFLSQVKHWADHPPRYLDPKKARDFVQATPTTWDETVVLPVSEIGTTAAFARRKGKTWFLAILNGQKETRTLEALPLDFLGEREYELVTLSDETQQSLRRNRRSGVDSSDTLDVHLLPGGGFVGWFRPVE